jgi:hypothetical protein
LNVHIEITYTFFKGKKIEDILEDPTRSFNCDESFIRLSPGKQKFLTAMGSKDVYLIQKFSDKSGVTVLATTSASGWILPLFIIYPYERLQNWMAKDKLPPGFEVRMDDSGSILFLVASPIIPQLKTKNTKFPFVLCMDGHRSHINIKITDICSENNIELICFPPNTTHILQPCDVALFNPLKGL